MMKYIKLFESYKDIELRCEKYKIVNYTINNDNTIDVNESVHINHRSLIVLPIEFNNINGNLSLAFNKLISLKGAPLYINGYFNCMNNDLSSLKYCAKYIKDSFCFNDNYIFSLDNIDKVGGDIYYDKNPIEELISLFNEDAKLYLEYLELYNFQKNNIIYKARFMDALKDFHSGWSSLPELKRYIYQ